MLALTTNEVAALTGLDEKFVRKDVEQGVVEALTPPRFAEHALVYFFATAAFAFHLATAERRRLYRMVSKAVENREPTLELGPGWTLDIAAICAKLLERQSGFEAWKAGLVEDEGILGGEPIFPKSRLAVRHVGEMLRRGATAAEVLEDYPYLSERDLDYARLYTTAYPRIGRPRAQAPAR